MMRAPARDIAALRWHGLMPARHFWARVAPALIDRAYFDAFLAAD